MRGRMLDFFSSDGGFGGQACLQVFDQDARPPNLLPCSQGYDLYAVAVLPQDYDHFAPL